MRLRIDPGKCQGHGRCYDLSPDLFGDDDEGYGQVLANGSVPADKVLQARKAVANCPESAVALTEE